MDARHRDDDRQLLPLLCAAGVQRVVTQPLMSREGSWGPWGPPMLPRHGSFNVFPELGY